MKQQERLFCEAWMGKVTWSLPALCLLIKPLLQSYSHPLGGLCCNFEQLMVLLNLVLGSYLISMQLKGFFSACIGAVRLRTFEKVLLLLVQLCAFSIAHLFTYRVLTLTAAKLCVSEMWLAVSRQRIVLVVCPTSFVNIKVCQNMI